MTIKFNNAYLSDSYTLLGRNEHGVTISADEVINDYYMDLKSVEQAESMYQVKTICGLLNKCNLKENDIDLLVGGDLQNQLFATNYALRNFDISFLGHYSACSSFTGSIIIACSLLKFNNIKNVIVNVSSHNLVSEKNFRYPIEYGAIKKYVNTFTATGSVSVLVNRSKSSVKIECATIGKVTDIGYKDTNNMGACMAPSIAKTLYEHFTDTGRNPSYYDLILTGDLGVYGLGILKDYMKKEYKTTIKNISDSGTLLFKESGKSIAGGSGPVCLPMVLFNKILKEDYKRILVVGTGSLHSKTSTNLNESVPSISHAISLEVINK